MKKTKLMLGDNMKSLKKLPDNSIDSIVTDPPYGLSFMSKKWDYDVPTVEFWKEVYRVLKPGGHILSFGGTRTYHRMVVNIEDAGFEIRDQVMWLYGSGFPKSHNIGKAVDKIEGNEREVVGEKKIYDTHHSPTEKENNWQVKDIPLTKGQSKYEGWGTALKPANEPICVARKPLSEKTIADNVMKWGTGGINIDGCRVEYKSDDDISGWSKKNYTEGETSSGFIDGLNNQSSSKNEEGRFPANIILDETAAELLDKQSGVTKSTPTPSHTRKGNVVADERTSKAAGIFGDGNMLYGSNHNDKGGASRFFYVAKVSKKERNLGLDLFEDKPSYMVENGSKTSGLNGKSYERTTIVKNNHPTLKPINLMTYLCRLITPEGGIVLDPFMGSGSTGISALLEGFRFVGMEMDADYFKIAEARIEAYEEYRKLIK